MAAEAETDDQEPQEVMNPTIPLDEGMATWLAQYPTEHYDHGELMQTWAHRYYDLLVAVRRFFPFGGLSESYIDTVALHKPSLVYGEGPTPATIHFGFQEDRLKFFNAGLLRHIMAMNELQLYVLMEQVDRYYLEHKDYILERQTKMVTYQAEHAAYVAKREAAAKADAVHEVEVANFTGVRWYDSTPTFPVSRLELEEEDSQDEVPGRDPCGDDGWYWQTSE